MGDFSYAKFLVRRTDVERVKELHEPSYVEDDEQNHAVEIQYESLRGGGYSLASELMEAGIPYIHTWEGLVGSYPPGVAVFDGANLTEFLAFDGQPAITCQPDGTLSDDIVAEFRAKLTDYRAVLALIEGE